MRSLLNEQERLFAIGYMHEQMHGEGTASKWVEKNGLAHLEVQPFTLHLSLELGEAPVPPAPEEYPVPWGSVEKFRRRSAELREKLDDAISQAQVDKNAHRKGP